MTIQYDPQDVTDWVTPLEKVYARQSNQLDKHYANLQTQLDQQYAADTQFNLPDAVHKLKDFAVTIKKFADVADAKKTKNVKGLYDSADVDQQKVISQLAKERKLDKTHTEFVQRVNKTNLPDKYKKLLTNKSGGNILRLEKIIGYEDVENFEDTLNTRINEDGETQAAFEQYKDNPGELKKWYINQQREHLKESFDWTDTYITTHFGDEIERFASTKSTLAGLKAKEVIFAVDGEANAKIVNASIYAFGNKQPNAVAEGAQALILEGVNKNEGIDLAKSTENTARFYYRLAKDGRFTDEALEALKSGKIERHPAGKHGDVLFSQTQFDQIQKGINEYNTAQYTKHQALNKASIITAFTNYQKSGNETDKSTALSTYLNNGGKTSDAEYKALENIKKFNPDIKKIETARLAEIDETGRRGQYTDEIQKMSNIDIVAEENKTKLYEANREQNGFDKKTSDTFATNLLKADLGFDISPLGKGLVPGTQTEIRDFISARRDEIYATVYNDPEQNRKTIGKTTDALLKDELTQMGLFASNDREDADYGILTSDGQGNFPGWEAQKQSKIEQSKGTNSQRTVRNLINELNEHKTIDNLLKNGKSITNAELLAVIDNIKDGKLTAFPPDVLLKGRIYGKQPSAVVLSKLEYLKNPTNTADKNFVKRFDLDLEELTKSIPSTDIQIRTILEGINDGRTLLSKFNRMGVEGFTPKELRRIILEDENKRVTDQKEKEEKEETRKMQTPDTQIGRYNTRS